MKLLGLRIDMRRFDAVSDATEARRTRSENGATGRGTLRVVSSEVLAETERSECKCENAQHMATLGLRPLAAGFLVDQLWELESGCTKGRWVCNRLNTVRRRYGK